MFRKKPLTKVKWHSNNIKSNSSHRKFTTRQSLR